MKPRTLLVAASAALILLVVWRPWAGEEAPGAGEKAPAVRPASELAPRARAGPDGPDRAAARVRGELAELREEVSRLGSAAAPAERPSPEEQQARADRRDTAQAALLVKTFAADTRDPSWSPDAERLVRDTFAAAPLPGARLAEVACGTALCRITVAFDSIEHRNESFASVVQLAPWPSRGFGDVSPDDPLRYVFYASRDHGSFPDIE